MEKQSCVLGMDIGGTNLRMGLVDSSLTVSHLEVIPTKTVYQDGNTAENIARLILGYCKRTLGESMPDMVAAGFPSVLDRERTQIYSSTNLPGLDGVNIVDVVGGMLGVPMIIEHDAYYLLAYDIHYHRIENTGTLLGFYFGTGMGNAIYMNGHPYVGKNGAASELGHMPVAFSQEPCGCGNRGCIEMHCCGKAFERLAGEHFPDDFIGDIFQRHSEHPAVDRFVRAMAVPVATEVNILDPHGIFIGGGLVQMQGFPKDRLVEYILQNTRKPYPAANLQIYFSPKSPKNGIAGAAIEGFRKLEAQGK